MIGFGIAVAVLAAVIFLMLRSIETSYPETEFQRAMRRLKAGIDQFVVEINTAFLPGIKRAARAFQQFTEAMKWD